MPPTPKWLQDSVNTTSYFAYPVKYAVSGMLRRMNSDVPTSRSSSRNRSLKPSPNSSSNALTPVDLLTGDPLENSYTPPPPRKITTPFQPPPLSPLSLDNDGLGRDSIIVSRLLAEEVRLLVPPRLQLVEKWRLAFSLERDGATLTTLYDKCDDFRGKRGGFVVAIRDAGGNVFGAYLSDPPRPSNGHYYGNGECFLWKASTLPALPSLANLPPPPSEDTTNATRMTTIGSPKSSRNGSLQPPLIDDGSGGTGTSTPERIRFKAFPYSGINDYMIFCEQGFFSVGGGDGHYGLWLDHSLEQGVSQPCPTFGNESLSDDGSKFEVIGVEIWFLGA